MRRFIDPEAEFLFVPTERVFSVASETGATAYDIAGAEPFSHDGELCSFDAVLKVYGIKDRALDTLALIVRGADTARLELAPQSPGLLALSLGLVWGFSCQGGCFGFAESSLFGAGKPFFIPSPAIRFAERAEGVKGPKR